MRSAASDETERSFWIEKLSLFGFPKLAETFKVGCINQIRKNALALRDEILKVQNCKYWTKIERLAIKAFIDGGLKDQEMIDVPRNNQRKAVRHG
jgi:hypothetical protein